MRNLMIRLLKHFLKWHDFSTDFPLESGSYLIYTEEGNIGEAEYRVTTGEWFQYRWSVQNPKVKKWIKLSDLLLLL